MEKLWTKYAGDFAIVYGTLRKNIEGRCGCKQHDRQDKAKLSF